MYCTYIHLTIIFVEIVALWMDYSIYLQLIVSLFVYTHVDTVELLFPAVLFMFVCVDLLWLEGTSLCSWSKDR